MSAERRRSRTLPGRKPAATLGSGGHAFFFEHLSAHRAPDLIYAGELMSGTDVVAAGLFSRTIPDDELLDFGRDKA